MRMTTFPDLSALPGGDLVRRGVTDLDAGRETPEALLVSIGAPRLRAIGVEASKPISDPEHKLYLLLASKKGDAAHLRLQRPGSASRQLRAGSRVRELADSARIERFMRELGRSVDVDGRVYLTGGATAVLNGWRESTIDVDIKLIPDRDEILREIPRLKQELDLNIELAAPSDFIPLPRGWEERSPLIRTEGRLSFHHFDPVAQALSKAERGHEQDIRDVREMLESGLVNPAEAMAQFEAIEPELYRFPAIDPASFRKAVEELFRG